MAARSAGSEDDDRPPQIHSAFLTIDLPPTMLEYKEVPRSRRLGRYPVTLPHGSSHAGRKNATKAKQDAKWHGERCQFAAPRYVASWHETDVLCVPTNVCSWWKSGHEADITARPILTRTRHRPDRNPAAQQSPAVLPCLDSRREPPEEPYMTGAVSYAAKATDERVTCLRIFADASGETHMQDINIGLQPRKLFKDNPALHLTDTLTASGCNICHIPSGMCEVSWHNPPHRMLVIWLTGEVEFET